MQCQGVTSTGRACKNKGPFNGYCRHHVPTLYVKHVDWPSFRDANTGVRPCSCVEQIVGSLQLFTFEMQLRTAVDSVEKQRFENRRLIVRSAELCMMNAPLMYDDSGLENLASIIASKLDTVPELKDYTEDFRRKCVKSHREEAKKKLKSFYFKRCEDLCDDMIWEILQRV